jgi:hypothetical protein
VEIVLDKRVFYGLAIVSGVALLGVIYLIVTTITGAATTAKITDLIKQNISIKSICSQKDAMQMYLQSPNSTHPYVVKLRKDIEIYDKLAAELRKNGSLVSDFTNCN